MKGWKIVLFSTIWHNSQCVTWTWKHPEITLKLYFMDLSHRKTVWVLTPSESTARNMILERRPRASLVAYLWSGWPCVAVWDMGNWGGLFQILVAAPKWITWLVWTNKIRISNEAKLETRVIAIGERLGGMWSVSRPKLGHPARRDWGQGELAESPNTPDVTVAIGDVGEQSVRGASFIF